MKKYPKGICCAVTCCFISYTTLAAETTVKTETAGVATNQEANEPTCKDYASLSKSTALVYDQACSNAHKTMKLVANELKVRFMTVYDAYQKLDATKKTDTNIESNLNYWNKRIVVDLPSIMHSSGDLETLFQGIAKLMIEECIPCYNFLNHVVQKIPELKQSIVDIESGKTIGDVSIPVDKFFDMFIKKCSVMPRDFARAIKHNEKSVKGVIQNIIIRETNGSKTIKGSDVSRDFVQDLVYEAAKVLGRELTEQEKARIDMLYGNLILQIAASQEKYLKEQKKLEKNKGKETTRKSRRLSIHSFLNKKRAKTSETTEAKNTDENINVHKNNGTVAEPVKNLETSNQKRAKDTEMIETGNTNEKVNIFENNGTIIEPAKNLEGIDKKKKKRLFTRIRDGIHKLKKD